jgi:hypothetical protein
MSGAELAARRERAFRVGAELFCDEPVRAPLAFGHEHADAFLAAFEETVRELH